MSMSVTEANAFNALLHYFLGYCPREINKRKISFDEAKASAMKLAASANKTLMAGVDAERAAALFDRVKDAANSFPNLTISIPPVVTEGARVVVKDGMFAGRIGIAESQNAGNKAWYVRLQATPNEKPTTVQMAAGNLAVEEA